MTLSDYLEHTGLTYGDFAAKVGVSKSAISLYISGKRTPRPGIARRIVKATRGAVTLHDALFGSVNKQGRAA